MTNPTTHTPAQRLPVNIRAQYTALRATRLAVPTPAGCASWMGADGRRCLHGSLDGYLSPSSTRRERCPVARSRHSHLSGNGRPAYLSKWNWETMVEASTEMVLAGSGSFGLRMTMSVLPVSFRNLS